MTFAPKSLLDVRAYLKPRTGLSDVELGISGDPAHAAGGTSYHLGRDDLDMAINPYSVRTARDKAGLTNAASAEDIGMFPRLREFSVWLVARCRKGAADCADIREVIYSPDGLIVLRWDRERGVTSAPRTGEADDSHLFHTHISWYRDSEFHDRLAVFRVFFEGDDVHEFYQVTGKPEIYHLRPGVGRYHLNGDEYTALKNGFGAGNWRLVSVASAAILDLVCPPPAAAVPAELAARLDAILAAASDDGDVTVQMSPEQLAEVRAIRDAVAAVPQATADLVHADLAD